MCCDCRAEFLPLPAFIRSILSRFGPTRTTTLLDGVSPAIVEQAKEGILIADMRAPDARIVYVNGAFEAISGYARDEVIGKNCRYLQGSDRLQPEIGLMREAFAAGQAIRVRLRNYRKDGSLFWNELHLVPLGNGAGMPSHYVGFIRDVTELVATAAKLEKIKHIDALTGCLNRDALVEHLSRRTQFGRMLLVKLDIARFHEINGGYGYDVATRCCGRRHSGSRRFKRIWSRVSATINSRSPSRSTVMRPCRNAWSS